MLTLLVLFTSRSTETKTLKRSSIALAWLLQGDVLLDRDPVAPDGFRQCFLESVLETPAQERDCQENRALIHLPAQPVANADMRWQQRFENYGRALARLDQALGALLLPWRFDLSLKAELQSEALLSNIDQVGQVFYRRHDSAG